MMDKQFLRFLCGAFLLLHSQPTLANAGSSEKKLDTKPKKKQRGPSVAESDK
jgi:hypothetical protein